MNIDEITQVIGTFEFTDFVEPVGLDLIDAAESELGHPLSREYREFLNRFGCGGVESEEFIGLGGKPHLNVVQMHKDLMQRLRPLPARLIPIRADGFGNYDCIDTSISTSDGDFAVVQWIHDNGPHQVLEQLATSYFEWFVSILELIEQEEA